MIEQNSKVVGLTNEALKPERRDDLIAQETSQPRRRILVVNDTPEILQLIQEILEEEGYDVTSYSYAIRDLAEVKAVNPDLMILDFMMGGEDFGWQFLQKLKLDRQTATIPIIVCTAAVSLVREIEGRLHEKGVGIVLKPFDIDELLREINAMWRARSATGAPSPTIAVDGD